MRTNTDIRRRVDEAMASIDAIGRAEPKPFFFTRLEARLARNSGNGWDRLSKAVTRPAIAFATLAVVVVLNAAVIATGMSAVENVPDYSEMASTEDLRASTSFYDIENSQP